MAKRRKKGFSGVLKGVSPLTIGGVLRGGKPLSSLKRGVVGGLFPPPSTPFRLNARRLLRSITPFNSNYARKFRTPGVERLVRQSLPLSTQITICKRRHQRREVLFAVKGLNGSAPKRITEQSKVRC
ncbi:MAG: hypothetical protein [Microviridae sp.]|nr:MAG: hypothetical protein [Microviridae sp.]